MRILYVITQGEMGGAQLYIKSLAQAGKSLKHGIFTATGRSEDNWLEREILAAGAEYEPLKNLVRKPSPIKDIPAIFELAGLFRKIKPDVIHLNSSKAGIIGSLAYLILNKRERAKIKLFYTVHGWVFNEPMPLIIKAAYFWMEKITAPMKLRLICVSEYDRWIGLGKKISPPDKLITIHNGIDAAAINFLDQTKAREKLQINKLPANTTVIGAIANFYPTKGLEYLISAIKILTHDYKLPIKAVIIGDGKLRPQLELQIEKLKLADHIILTGRKPEAARYLKAFDIAVMPSVKEGFPYFLLEAMAAGLSIVASKVGGIPEIVCNNETGYLVEAKNPRQLANKIRLLAEDNDLRIKFGKAGTARVKEEFGLQRMIDETFALYELK
jgi:glycosyltransferase involved in cell wall biosynthesis